MSLLWWVLVQYTGVLLRGKFGQRDTEMRPSGKDGHTGKIAIWIRRQRLLCCQAMSRVPRSWKRKGRILPNYDKINACVFKPLTCDTFYGHRKNLIKMPTSSQGQQQLTRVVAVEVNSGASLDFELSRNHSYPLFSGLIAVKGICLPQRGLIWIPVIPGDAHNYHRRDDPKEERQHSLQ